MNLVVRVWPWVLALLVLYPVLSPGYVLSYDMVFVPDLALRSDFLGFGSGLPRAVPSDAVVAVADEVVPGQVLQKLLLVGALVLAGTGASRLVPAGSGVAQLAATSLYVWNPFVAERLGIGHWPVLLAYAALPWIFDSARRLRAGERTLPGLTLWLALAALSISGGVMGALTALALVIGRGREGVRRAAVVLACVLAVNLPWIVAGLLHGGGGRTDPAGVGAFAARGEGMLPLPLTLLGLGGIWNSEVVPVSRTGASAVLALGVLAVGCLLGVRSWLAWLPRRDAVALTALGAVGLAFALSGPLFPDAMGDLVEVFPGAGVFRDGSRFVGLLALAQASLFGMGAAALSRVRLEAAGRVALAVGAVLAPLAVMPDLAAGVSGRLAPVAFPDEYDAARDALVSASDGKDGSLLVLPFASYRLPSYNEGRRVLDPLGRFFSLNYVTGDDLYVSGRRVEGEDPRAARIQGHLRRGLPADALDEALRGEGIRWLATDHEAAAAIGADAATAPPIGRLVHAGPGLTVRELEGSVDTPRWGLVRTGLLTIAWVALGLALTVASGLAAVRMRRRHREGDTGGLTDW